MEILECICRQTDVLLNESPELVPRVILYLKVKVEIWSQIYWHYLNWVPQ